MTRRAALPTLHEVHTAITELTEAAGKPPTALALARHLGLANTTFRRNFPDITSELTHRRTPPSASENADATTRFEQLKQDNDKLRRDNHELTAHLELAVANIQRLTLDNHQLRRALETANTVTKIDRTRRIP